MQRLELAFRVPPAVGDGREPGDLVGKGGAGMRRCMFFRVKEPPMETGRGGALASRNLYEYKIARRAAKDSVVISGNDCVLPSHSLMGGRSARRLDGNTTGSVVNGPNSQEVWRHIGCRYRERSRMWPVASRKRSTPATRLPWSFRPWPVLPISLSDMWMPISKSL